MKITPTIEIVNPSIYKLDKLIAWLAQQPADETYMHTCPDECMLARYFKANGHPRAQVGIDEWAPEGVAELNGCVPVALPFNLACVEAEAPYTFGAALDRARLRAEMSREDDR